MITILRIDATPDENYFYCRPAWDTAGSPAGHPGQGVLGSVMKPIFFTPAWRAAAIAMATRS